MFTGTAVPWVTLTGLPEFNCKVAEVAVNVTSSQLSTKLAASTDPRPVARSYPGSGVVAREDAVSIAGC